MTGVQPPLMPIIRMHSISTTLQADVHAQFSLLFYLSVVSTLSSNIHALYPERVIVSSWRVYLAVFSPQVLEYKFHGKATI